MSPHRSLSARAPAADIPRGDLRSEVTAQRRLNSLRQASSGCRECPLGECATQTVFGEGAPRAPLMLVGEQPGDREDLEGHPFVGPAGTLLGRALKQLDWPREALYVTNAVKHFKYELRGTRRMHKTPAQREAAACLHWLESEIEAVQPQAIVALGAVAARSLLGRPVPVLRERGHWLPRSDDIPVLVTLHPAALLRGDRAHFEEAFEAWLVDLGRATRYVREKQASLAARAARTIRSG
jgi:uracil-DNA glycosylase